MGEDVVSIGDIFITTTGNKGILMADSIGKMKNNAIIGNIGHFDNEIDMDGVMKVCKRINIKPQVDKFVFPDGKGVIVLAEGRLLNLGCLLAILHLSCHAPSLTKLLLSLNFGRKELLANTRQVMYTSFLNYWTRRWQGYI